MLGAWCVAPTCWVDEHNRRVSRFDQVFFGNLMWSRCYSNTFWKQSHSLLMNVHQFNWDLRWSIHSSWKWKFLEAGMREHLNFDVELHIFESGEKTRSKACDGEFFRFFGNWLDWQRDRWQSKCHLFHFFCKGFTLSSYFDVGPHFAFQPGGAPGVRKRSNYSDLPRPHPKRYIAKEEKSGWCNIIIWPDWKTISRSFGRLLHPKKTNMASWTITLLLLANTIFINDWLSI